MLPVQSVSIAVLLAVVVLLCSKCTVGHPSIRQRQEMRPQCETCGEFCERCDYGVTISSLCGVKQCKRGPDQRCGGTDDHLGVCGAGMKCDCNICTGCSTDTYRCSTEYKCSPQENSESRYKTKAIFLSAAK